MSTPLKKDDYCYTIHGSLGHLANSQFVRFADFGSKDPHMRHIIGLTKQNNFNYGSLELGKKAAAAVLKGVGDAYAKHLLRFPIVPFDKARKYSVDGDLCADLLAQNEMAMQNNSVSISSLIGPGLLRAAVIRTLISYSLDMSTKTNKQLYAHRCETSPYTITRKDNWTRACKVHEDVTSVYATLYTSTGRCKHPSHNPVLEDNVESKCYRHVHSPDNLLEALFNNNFSVVGFGFVSNVVPMCSHALLRRRPAHFGEGPYTEIQREVKIVLGGYKSPYKQKMYEASKLFAEILDGLGLIAYAPRDKEAYIYTKLQVMEYAQMLLLYIDGALNTIKLLKSEYGYENKEPVEQFFRIMKLALTYYTNVIANNGNEGNIVGRLSELSKHVPEDATQVVNRILGNFKHTGSICTPSAVSLDWNKQVNKFVALMVHAVVDEMPAELLGKTAMSDPNNNGFLTFIKAKSTNNIDDVQHAQRIDRFIARIGHMLFTSDFGPFVSEDTGFQCAAFGAMVLSANVHYSMVRHNVHPRDSMGMPQGHRIYAEFMMRMAQVIDVNIKFESPYSVNSPLFSPELLYRPDILAYARSKKYANRFWMNTHDRIMSIPRADNEWFGAVKVPYHPFVSRRIILENKKFANITAYR